MRQVQVNGVAKTLKPGAETLAAILQEAGVAIEIPGSAAARNGEVVPRSMWETTTLENGDVIEVVMAAQGG